MKDRVEVKAVGTENELKTIKLLFGKEAIAKGILMALST